MSDPNLRIEALLVERSDRPLTDAESAELATLLEQCRDWHVDDFELAAAAFTAVVSAQSAPENAPLGAAEVADEGTLPSSLFEQLAADGVRELLSTEPLSRAPAPSAPTPTAPIPVQGANTAWYVAAAGWAVAAMAVIGFALYAPKPVTEGTNGATNGGKTNNTAGTTPTPRACPECPTTEPIAPEPSPSPQALRSQLVADNGLEPWVWSRTEDAMAGDVAGDVVWDPESQRGYMRFRGLPINDPEVRQYQLWIFDGERSADHPVDGGVFDIAADGELVVPIEASIEVKDAQMFAVTVEPPGGVVVSKREHIVALAKVDTADKLDKPDKP